MILSQKDFMTCLLNKEKKSNLLFSPCGLNTCWTVSEAVDRGAPAPVQ